MITRNQQANMDWHAVAKAARPKDVKLKSAGNIHWCGPTAISAVAGCTTGHVQRLVAAERSKRSQRRTSPANVKGMYFAEMIRCLDKLGYEAYKVFCRARSKENVTLRKYMKERSGPTWRAHCIIAVTGHYVYANRDQIIDSYRPNGLPYDEHPCKGRRVNTVWVIRPKRKR